MSFVTFSLLSREKPHEHQLWPLEPRNVVEHPVEFPQDPFCLSSSIHWFTGKENRYCGTGFRLPSPADSLCCQVGFVFSLCPSLALSQADLSSCVSQLSSIFTLLTSLKMQCLTLTKPYILSSQGSRFWTLDSTGKAFHWAPGAKSYPPYLWVLPHYLAGWNKQDFIIWGWQWIPAPGAGIQHSHPTLPARLLTGWWITGAQPGSHRNALSE